MNIKLRNTKVAVLLLCVFTILAFFGCQAMEDTISQADLYESYGARYYDPSLARFSTIDPVAEKYPNISPYAYQVKAPIYIKLADFMYNNLYFRN